MYYLVFVKHSTPNIKKFLSKKSLDKFIESFKFDDDNWLDFYFKSNKVEFLSDWWRE